jgi:serine O-acetyltransferase
MTHRELVQLVRSDLHRYEGRHDRSTFVRLLFTEPGFEYTFWLRLVEFLRTATPSWRLLYPLARLWKRHLSFKYGVTIPSSTSVGPGLYIGHTGGIVINAATIIGHNCNISQGVTLGQTNRGARQGAPHIGDYVYLGPGAKVIGGVRVGSHVAVGANAVVSRDVPEHAVVGGVPATILSYDGSEGYINRTDYPA